MLNWKDLTILLSVNMLRKGSFNPKHYLREKWLDATLIVQKTSARRVLIGTRILSTILWLFWLSLLVGSLLDLPKNVAPIFKLWEIWISEYFFPDAWLVKLLTPIFDTLKLFWEKLQYACHLLCVLLSHSENLLSLNQASLNKHLFLVFADILY